MHKTRISKSESMRVMEWSLGYPGTAPNVTIEIDSPRWSGLEFCVGIGLDGELESVLVRRAGRAVPLSAALFRDIPVGALTRVARAHIRGFKEGWEEWNPPGASELLETDALLEYLDKPAYGSDDDRDLRLAQMCRRYLQLHDGGRLHPMWKRILASEFPPLKESSVPTTIMRARNKRHLLTPVAPGQSGGELTEKARRLLGPTPSAWDRLTAAQKQDALRRDGFREPIKRDLSARHTAGEIDRKWWRLLNLALEPLITRFTVREIYGDDPDLVGIEAAAKELLKTYPELKP